MVLWFAKILGVNKNDWNNRDWSICTENKYFD